MDDRRQARLFAGAILILLGLVLFAQRFIGGFGANITLLLIGGAFVAGYLYRRAYGLLIPGCILLGLGLASVGERSLLAFGDLSSIGLGVGFLAIYVIARVVEGRTHWWPLIPGGILLVTGLASGNQAMQRLLEVGWPVILILLGLLVLAGGWRRSGRGADTE